MYKSDLRKVYYTLWTDPSNDKKGYFHKFGDAYDSDSDSVLTYAVIENAETGLVEMIPPTNIRFVDGWD